MYHATICVELLGLIAASELITGLEAKMSESVGGVVIVGWNPNDEKFESVFDSDIDRLNTGTPVGSYPNIKVWIPSDPLLDTKRFYVRFAEEQRHGQKWFSTYIIDDPGDLTYICVEAQSEY